MIPSNTLKNHKSQKYLSGFIFSLIRLKSKNNDCNTYKDIEGEQAQYPDTTCENRINIQKDQ